MLIGISNSDAGEFSKCEVASLKKSHPESNLMRRDSGPARSRGTMGHHALELFYAAIKKETPYLTAVEEAMEFIWDERVKSTLMSNVERTNMCKKLEGILAGYFEYYREDVENWEIVSTENFHAMEAEKGDGFYLPMRLDMVIYQRKGDFAGEISPLDHKFTDKWWREPKFRLNSQMPLQIRALRQATFPSHPKAKVNRAILNFIRTAELKNPSKMDLYQRRFWKPDGEEQPERVFQNHLKIARRIEPLRRMPLKDAYEIAYLNLNGFACDFCDFKNICALELEGRDPKFDIEVEFTQNTYGYSELEMFDDGT